mmetsp:Transcript_74705/g.207721  ORF Transcript_74705/g.207721 Transcript_74705/m.207721 type:complete len:124 (+) Transcript_74705:854-1225(+)
MRSSKNTGPTNAKNGIDARHVSGHTKGFGNHPRARNRLNIKTAVTTAVMLEPPAVAAAGAFGKHFHTRTQLQKQLHIMPTSVIKRGVRPSWRAMQKLVHMEIIRSTGPPNARKRKYQIAAGSM